MEKIEDVLAEVTAISSRAMEEIWDNTEDDFWDTYK